MKRQVITMARDFNARRNNRDSILNELQHVALGEANTGHWLRNCCSSKHAATCNRRNIWQKDAAEPIHLPLI